MTIESMTTTLSSPDHRVVLANITWDLYESLLMAHSDCSSPRFTYDRGQLEIMSPSDRHEQLKDSVTLFVNVVAEELGINAKGFGSTTFRRKDIKRGFEPDASFYIRNLHKVMGKAKLDLRVDPPPDLAIEIDITSSSLNKLSILAQLEVPEVWTYDNEEWRILRLDRKEYKDQNASDVLPGLTVETISKLMSECFTLLPLDWIKQIRKTIDELI